MVNMRKKDQILKEIEETHQAALKLKSSGCTNNELEFFEGWNQALMWVLTNSDIEGDA